MNGLVPNLFKGIAVVIDNGIGKGDTIDEILENIRASGGHAVSLLKLPNPDYDLEHFSRASFFIMDWNLKDDEDVALGSGVTLPSTLGDEMVNENIAFLKRLNRNRHAPVFIFTNEEPENVKAKLLADDDLRDSVQQSHIKVMRKVDVAGRLYEVLEEWALSMPSVLTLKTWERSYLQAANDLFIDLHSRTPYWPVLLWQTFVEDEVPPAVEMARLLNRLVESRMEPMPLELSAFVAEVEAQKAKDEAAYRSSMHKVLEGERFLRDDRLDRGIFAPGDVFAFPVQGGATSHWMNVRAECDCLRGSDEMELHLLQLKKVEDPESKINPQYGTFTDEKDGEAIVFAMIDGITYSIRFKDMRIKSLKTIRKAGAARVGRLLPPFVTRVQQRYAAYVQRPGMPRIPSALYRAA